MKTEQVKTLKGVCWHLCHSAHGSTVGKVRVLALVSGALDRVSVCQLLLPRGVTFITWGQFEQQSLLHLSAGTVCASQTCLRVVWILTAERIPAAFTTLQMLFWENIPWPRIFSSERQALQYPEAGQVEYAAPLLISFSKVISTHAHEAEHFFTYPSRLQQAPLPGPGLHFHYPCFLGWCVASACQYQGLYPCHLSQLSSKHYKSWCSSQADMVLWCRLVHPARCCSCGWTSVTTLCYKKHHAWPSG